MMMTFKMKRPLVTFCATLALSLSFMTSTTDAQVRSQNKLLTDGPDDNSRAIFAGPSMDYASEMRKFIQNVAQYGRSFKRDFLIIIKDGNGLLTQIIDIDQLITAPSSAFIKTLDGLIQPSPSFGADGFGVATNKKDQEQLLKDLQIARDTGLKVFTLDYASKPKDVDKAIRFAAKNKFIPYVAPGMGFKNNKLPNWPRRPYKENSHTISNIQLVKNYALVNDSSRFGSAEEYAMKMHNTNYDMIVTNVFHHRSQTLGKHNVRTMQYKKLGTRRPVLAHINIGVADVGAYYWKNDWRQGNPPFILDLAPASSDQYPVQYWHPGWQQIIFGNNKSFLYGIMKEGYDGIVIDGVNAYEIFANPE